MVTFNLLGDVLQSSCWDESVALVQKDCVALVRAVLCHRLLNIVYPIRKFLHLENIFLDLLRVIFMPGCREVELPVGEGLRIKGCCCLSNLLFLERVHDDKAQLYFLLGSRLQINLFVPWRRQNFVYMRLLLGIVDGPTSPLTRASPIRKEVAGLISEITWIDIFPFT